MMGLLVAVHVIICALLIVLILIQRGRGGGLAESFSDVESMLGTKTNAFLTRTTTILSTLFFITCLSLAVLSIKQSRSLLRDTKTKGAAVEQTGPLVTPRELPAAEGAAAKAEPPKAE